MTEVLPEFFHLNGIWMNATPGRSIAFNEEFSIYEVIRTIDAIPLFIEDHLGRLQQSANLIHFNLWLGNDEAKQIIHQLIEKNQIRNGNIKLAFNHLRGTSEKNIICAFIPSFYPNQDLYKRGAISTLHFAERNVPNAKKSDIDLRTATNKIIATDQVYEVILVNHLMQLTEGSRSNLFFIKDDQIFTPPAKQVLEGITRQKIIQICVKNKIPVIERIIHQNKLSNFDAAFFSGTSPKVLPISAIEEYTFDPSNALLKKLMELYELEISNYIRSAKK